MASQKKYDFIFTGFGASSCILVHEMHKKGMLENKSILVLDPSAKKANDKTYCFWANKDSEIVKDYGSLISHNWPKIAIDDGIAQDIGQLNYFHINSLDLYEASKALLMSYDTTFALETVNVITHTGEPHVKTDSGEYIGDSVFDARPPEMNQKLLSDQNILQSFVGYKVQLKKFKLKKDTCTLMDFKVAQQGYTQFVYVLPYSKDSALIELTRFGKAPISREESKGILENYILEKYGDYELLEIEKGVIPMFMELPKLEKIKGVIPIGTRANKVKPSTGYAFKNMHEHAKSLCSSVKITKKANRFRVYDRLLILILALWPEKGKPLFSFDMDFFNLEEDDNYILNLPGQFSANPFVCYTPYNNVPTDESIKFNVDIPETSISDIFSSIKDKFIVDSGKSQYLGRLAYVYINFQYIKKCLAEAPRNSTDNSLALLPFIKTVLSGICKARGGINNILIHEDINTNSIKFIEEVPQNWSSTIPPKSEADDLIINARNIIFK